jgi:hypothetical protein
LKRLVRVGLPMAAVLGAGLLMFPAESPASAACAKAPSAACLADLAVEAGLADHSPPPYIRDLKVLPMMGRFDQAQTLLDHLRAAQEPRPTPAQRWDHLTSHRIAAGIRNGMTVADAIATVPDAISGYLYIAALDLLGRNPYGPIAPPMPAPDAVTLKAVAGLADVLVGMETGLNPYQRSSALSDAAELRVLLGDVAGAKDAIALMPTDLPDPQALGATLTLAVGPDIALAFCPPQEQCRPYALRYAAAAAPPEQAKALLTEAFDLAANAPYVDSDAMSDVVDAAVDQGRMDLALGFARRMVDVAANRKGVFPAFPHIHAAHALLAAGAPPEEVRASLARAETEFPDGAPDTIVGVGIVSGPIAWAGGGLKAEARRNMALIRAQLGDLDHVFALMQNIEDPYFAWGEVLVPDLPVATLRQLLDAAKAAMTAQEFARLKAHLAQNIFLSDTTDAATRDWALALARTALAEAPLRGESALYTCEALARVGNLSGDATLLDAALSNAARIALEQGDAQSLLLAASLWHAYGRRP